MEPNHRSHALLNHPTGLSRCGAPSRPAPYHEIRVTTSIAIILLVGVEMIGAECGIGAFVLSAGNLYHAGNLLAGIVVLSALGRLIVA